MYAGYVIPKASHSFPVKMGLGVQEIGKNKVSPNKFRMFLSETNGSQGQNTKKISI